jgi:hypothetical protein
MPYDNKDIRAYFTPPKASGNEAESPMQRNWTRNRRIVESDSEEDATDLTQPDQIFGNVTAIATHQNEIELSNDPPQTYENTPSAAYQPDAVITISDDDDMRKRPLNATENPTMPPIQMSTASGQLTSRRLTTRMRRRRDPHIRSVTQRSRYEDEAQESRHTGRICETSSSSSTTTTTTTTTASTSSTTTGSGSDDDSWIDCDESDEDAIDMYQSTISSMRNARLARQQLRASTTTCPVCAKFASFLQHFM